MTKWMVKQETGWIEFDDDEYSYPGPISFFSPASPTEGFYYDRELDPDEIPDLLMKLDEVHKATKGNVKE